jgi:hypothetical protein
MVMRRRFRERERGSRTLKLSSNLQCLRWDPRYQEQHRVIMNLGVKSFGRQGGEMKSDQSS